MNDRPAIIRQDLDNVLHPIVAHRQLEAEPLVIVEQPRALAAARHHATGDRPRRRRARSGDRGAERHAVAGGQRSGSKSGNIVSSPIFVHVTRTGMPIRT